MMLKMKCRATSLADRAHWRLAPDHYSKRKLNAARKKYKLAQRSSFMSPSKLVDEAEEAAYREVQEWYDLWQEARDEKLVRRGSKMGISLHDIPVPKCDGVAGECENSNFECTSFGNKLLRGESRRAIERAIRDRGPTYRKEKRELFEILIKVVGLLLIVSK